MSIWDATEPCPCGRMNKSPALWCCRCCYLEKEIGYALTELERPGAYLAGIGRLKRLTGVKEEAAV